MHLRCGWRREAPIEVIDLAGGVFVGSWPTPVVRNRIMTLRPTTASTARLTPSWLRVSPSSPRCYRGVNTAVSTLGKTEELMSYARCTVPTRLLDGVHGRGAWVAVSMIWRGQHVSFAPGRFGRAVTGSTRRGDVLVGAVRCCSTERLRCRGSAQGGIRRRSGSEERAHQSSGTGGVAECSRPCPGGCGSGRSRGFTAVRLRNHPGVAAASGGCPFRGTAGVVACC